MSQPNRRQCFKLLLSGMLQTAGTAIVASAVLPVGATEPKTSQTRQARGKDIQQRADQLTDLADVSSEEAAAWVNGGFRNAAFRNAVGGGEFRNGGFTNGAVGGGFRNGGFVNGAWRNL
jgi:hypothetical protein